jgi:hypothetical protein
MAFEDEQIALGWTSIGVISNSIGTGGTVGVIQQQLVVYDTTPPLFDDGSVWDALPIGAFPPSDILQLQAEDTTEDPIFDDGKWDPLPSIPDAPIAEIRSVASFFDLLDLVTEPLAQDEAIGPIFRDFPEIIAAPAEDDFEPETGLDLVIADTSGPVSGDGAEIAAVAAEDDFEAEVGLDLVRDEAIGPVFNGFPEVVAVLADDDFEPETGLDFVSDEALGPVFNDFPEIIAAPADDDFEPETGLDFVQSDIQTVGAFISDGTEVGAFPADDDFEAEAGLDLTQSNLSEAPPPPPPVTDVYQYSFSFFDLLDLITESDSQPNLTEDGPPAFDGALVEVVFDTEQRIDTTVAQSNLIEPSPGPVIAPPDVFQSTFSFFDLTDLVTEQLSQPNLTEAAPVIPDLIESVLGQDTSEVEDDDTLDRYRLIQALLDGVDDPILIPSLDDPEVTDEPGEDLYQAYSDITNPIVSDGTDVSALDAQDDFEPETGIDFFLDRQLDDVIIITTLDPAIVALDADDDFQPEDGVDIVLALPPDDAPPTPPSTGLNVGGSISGGYFSKKKWHCLVACMAAEKRAAELKKAGKLRKATEFASRIIKGSVVDDDGPSPELAALTLALEGAASAQKIGDAIRHARNIEVAARAYQSYVREWEAADEEDAIEMLLL